MYLLNTVLKFSKDLLIFFIFDINILKIFSSTWHFIFLLMLLYLLSKLNFEMIGKYKLQSNVATTCV